MEQTGTAYDSADTPARPRIVWHLLGAVEARLDGRALDLGPPLRQTLLATLLAHVGEPVSMPTLIEAMWGENSPDGAINVVHKHIGALRRVVDPGLPKRAQGDWLTSGPGGYRVDVDADDLDLLRFRDLVARAQGVGDDTRAYELLSDALALWTGPAAEGLRGTVAADAQFAALDREFTAAASDAGVLAERLRRPDRVLPALEAAAARTPTDERLHAALIRTLASAGRRDEALSAFRSMSRMLRDELGVEPGPALRAAHDDVLQDRVEAAASTPARLPVPAQLPADPGIFVGRSEELESLRELLPSPEHPSATVVVTGTAGVGKTTLAVHFATTVAEAFPDGQLYIDLQGFDPGGSPQNPSDVLSRFLEAFDVPASKIPRELDARSALWRSVVAPRRLLIVLDNARDTAHVAALLPGGTGSLTIVTSRSQLRSLAVTADHVLPLQLFDPDESSEFLARRLGSDREGAAGAADALHAVAGGLPLSLSLLAARATHDPHVTLADLVEQVRGSDGSLDPFVDRADPRSDTRAVLSWSYEALSPDAARLLRGISLYPGASVSIETAAALFGATVPETRVVVDELVEASLLGATRSGRYTCHDLLSRFAGEKLADAGSDERLDAETRMYADLVGRATTALHAIYPGKIPLPEEDAPSALPNPAATSIQSALTWYTDEFGTMVELALRAVSQVPLRRFVWQFAWALEQFLDRYGYWGDNRSVQLAAIAAARAAHRPQAEALSLRALTRVLTNMGQTDEARSTIEKAVRIAEQLPDGHPLLLSETHRYLGWVLETSGDYDGAIRESRAALDLLPADAPSEYRSQALDAIADGEIMLGHYQSALVSCFMATQGLMSAPDDHQLANVHLSFGTIFLRLGEHGRAMHHLGRALQHGRREGSMLIQASIAQRIAETLAASGHPRSARAVYQQALGVYGELRHASETQVRDALDRLDEGRAVAG